jgi:cellobiose phosphorylase
LRVTSYAEIVLAEQEADQRHPAFVKLFVESEYLSEYNALLFRRRLRSGKEKPIFMAHMLLMAGEEAESRRYESDRSRFLGRNNSVRFPQALQTESWLSGTTGATLDSVMSLGQEIELEPYATVELAFVTVVAGSRQDTEALLGRYRSWSRLGRVFDLARGHAEHEMQQFNLHLPLEIVQRLLSLLLYPHPALRADHETLAANTRGQPGLWAYGISGDHPILLLQLSDEAESALLQELVQVHAYWYGRGLKIDLVILNEQESGYELKLQDFIHRLIRRADAADRLQKRGGERGNSIGRVPRR